VVVQFVKDDREISDMLLQYFNQIWYGILTVTIGLVITSVYVLRLLPLIFENSENVARDQFNIRVAVCSVSCGFVLKIIVCSVSKIAPSTVETVENKYSLDLIAGCTLIFWTVSEFIPICILLLIHKVNF
jgi:hypothetical protein